MGNVDSSLASITGPAPSRRKGAEPTSARSWWRSRGRGHAHRHASSCSFESPGGRDQRKEGGACSLGVESCSQGAELYFNNLPWGSDDVFLDSGSCSAHFFAHTRVTSGDSLGFPSLPAGGAAGHVSCSSSGRTEDSGLGNSLILRAEVEAEPVEGAWPHLHPAHTSISSDGDAPCNSSSRKDFLKSRIRQLGDWTGSLSRKKRRVQAPYGSDSELVGCETQWTSNPLHTLNQFQVPAGLWGSTRTLPPSSDLQRLNVYASFMQELQTDRPELDDGEGEEEEEEETETNTDTEDEEEEVGGGGVGHQDLLVRRAGRLSFKPLLALSPDRKLQLVTRRKWKSFWVTLRGCTLLFYETSRTSSSQQQQDEEESTPRYTLLADGGIVQAVPEHPRREHVFCLSNSHGDVFLFQATSQSDLENWVTALHSASAALLARCHAATDTLRLLRRRCRSLLQQIDADSRMRKMAELQLSVIREPRSRRAVQSQIQQWEQNLEQLHLQLFQLRCYQSSLQGGELPNPKSLLAAASRSSKSMLGRLGVFSVSSFHALVCSREEAGPPSPPRLRGRLKGRSLPSSLKTLDRRSRRATPQDLLSDGEEVPPAGPPADVQVMEDHQPPLFQIFTLLVSRPDVSGDFGLAVTACVDEGGRSHVHVSDVDPGGPAATQGLKVGDKVLEVNGSAVSGLDLDLLQTLFSQQRELQLQLRRCQEVPAVKPGPAAAPDVQAWVSRCTSPGSSPPEGSGAAKGSLDVQKQRRPLTPAQRSSRSVSMGALCWVLPLEEEEQQGGEGPPGGWEEELKEVGCCLSCRRPEDGAALLPMAQVLPLYQTFPEGRAAAVPAALDLPRNPYEKEAGLTLPSPTHLSTCQRLRKVVQELVETEQSYVQDLVRLLDGYLAPLQQETFLSSEEVEALFGSLPEMLDFQKVFLQTLEDRVASCPDLGSLETPRQLQALLFALGGSFLDYADHFKHYSGFCVNHIKVQKVLERAKTDAAFKHFLESRNPTNQHSSSLESYLIKPVQRVLKYPLLLRELVCLTEPRSAEHTQLTEALRAMEKVASHINEMQKIYEDYGSVFEQLAAEQSRSGGRPAQISMDQFLVQTSALWTNPLPCLGRLRRAPELTLFVFKQAVILVQQDSSRLKKWTSGSRSADQDPFRFRWLIPLPDLQVRPTTGSEDPCVWELLHCRSEAEGRPQTIFSLRSSCPESKADVLRALRCLRSDSLRGSSATWRRRRRRLGRSQWQEEEEGREGQGVGLRRRLTCSEPLLPGHAPSQSRTRLCSLTGQLEAQLQRLHFTEEEGAVPGEGSEQTGEEEEEGRGWSPAHLLDRDFSVHSLASIVSEDCFYHTSRGHPAPRASTLGR